MIYYFQNGFISALPYLSSCLFSIPWSRFADWLIASKTLSRTNVRKLSTSVGLMLPAIALLLLAFANCDHTLPVIYLCIASGIGGATVSGLDVRPSHITRNHNITITSYLI